MSRKLRIFISSTMTDLANERDAVCRKLSTFNFEPVNAEGLLPNGFSSWDKIANEIHSCDIFILLIGERYGWIPQKGPKFQLGLSVTHLEYKEAQSIGIPILPFLKELSYGADKVSPDAIKRDGFRDEVTAWDNGYFISKFSLAYDLGEKVGSAIINLLSDEFQNRRIQERAFYVSKNTSIINETSDITNEILEYIPTQLISKIKSQDVLLFAGAGISLSAGLPSAAAFTEKLTQVIRKSNKEYERNGVGSAFAGVATDLEILKGREFLIDAVRSLIHLPQGILPTTAHMCAVRFFKQIVTTNYDTLFEDAAAVQGIVTKLIFDEINYSQLPNRAIIKLHGSYDIPNSLLLTERDVLLFDKSRKNLWEATCNLLKSKTIVVLGTSLRDPSIIRLFAEAGNDISGYFISPQIWEGAEKLVKKWNLEYLSASANQFFNTINQFYMDNN